MNVINEYMDERGNSPYAQWMGRLRDPRAKAKIILQVDKMELGLFGDVEPIGDGLSELRIHHGPGYRVYYGKVKPHTYLLLCGGDKSTQSRDIRKAKEFWNTSRRRHDHGT
jgi:putative addiction module killer protein|tara:strand:+ start:238 stop:570 length:333 start_codon:yes stop_codon:yes gene_type:complete